MNDAFWKWFGKSKFVDERGNPLVVYRGDADPHFHKFDRSKIRENAFFFTPDKAIAKIYSRHEEPREYYLSANKVLNLFSDDQKTEKFIRCWAENFDEWIDRQSGEEIDPVQAVQDGQLFDYEGDWSGERWLDLQATIEDAGYDGAILPDYDSATGVFPSFIVFRPNQIKAVDNDGTWDENDDDIRSNPRQRRRR